MEKLLTFLCICALALIALKMFASGDAGSDTDSNESDTDFE
jgi:hypothetical protein